MTVLKDSQWSKQIHNKTLKRTRGILKKEDADIRLSERRSNQARARHEATGKRALIEDVGRKSFESLRADDFQRSRHKSGSINGRRVTDLIHADLVDAAAPGSERQVPEWGTLNNYVLRWIRDVDCR